MGQNSCKEFLYLGTSPHCYLRSTSDGRIYRRSTRRSLQSFWYHFLIFGIKFSLFFIVIVCHIKYSTLTKLFFLVEKLAAENPDVLALFPPLETLVKRLTKHREYKVRIFFFYEPLLQHIFYDIV